MTIREELAQWLEKFCDTRGHVYPPELFGELADECLRQIEWARRECVEAADSETAEFTVMLPLTLAPPDWKP